MLTRQTKQISIITFFIISLVLTFWLGSRYPDLNAKAMMGSASSVQDTISVWPVLEVSASLPLWKKVLYSTINWIHDNMKGMTFGILLGGCAFALLPLLRIQPGGGRLSNAIYGMLLGTPLGVCVNCAAPVFKGVLQTRRLELAFAMMLSSPTLNIVVLTMVFSLFPLHLAVLKILFTLSFILLLLPLLSTLLAKVSGVKDWEKISQLENRMIAGSQTVTTGTCAIAQESWLEALRSGLMAMAKGVVHIAVRTAPLMLLAGALGALISHLIPFSIYSQADGLSLYAIIAAVTTLLPVPIAFDVILSNALYMQGLSVSVVAMLLCGLGIFSQYSFFVVWSSASRAWAVSLLIISFCLTLGVAYVAPLVHKQFFIDRNVAEFNAARSAWFSVEESAIDRDQLPEFSPGERAEDRILQPLVENDALVVQYRPFNQPDTVSGHVGAAQFTKKEGFELGLTRGFRYGIRDYSDPFWIGRGTGAGDIDNNGWPDIVLGSSRGPQVYLNRGGWFERQVFDSAALQALNTYNVALIDFDNDGFLDLFITTFEQGNFVLFNENGQLNPELVAVPNNDALLTISAGFSDFDGNGYLDILNGNMALGVVTASHQLHQQRTNAITFVQDRLFKQAALDHPGQTGETMATLIADLNGDGLADMYFANDFIVPDKVLYNQGRGFKEQTSVQGILPATPRFSMSVDVGDVNNDLIPDLLSMGTISKRPWVGQSAIDGMTVEQYSEQHWSVESCNGIKDPVHRNNCQINRGQDHILDVEHHRNMSVVDCSQLPTVILKQQCLMTTMWFLITNNIDFFSCEESFSFDKKLKRVCDVVKSRGKAYETADFVGAVSQQDDNFLYLGTSQGQFTNSNGQGMAFRHPGGWTWNGKFIDLDNDGWQDIMNAESAVRQHDYGWNVVMHNRQGKGFEQKQFSWNLTDAFGLFSFVSVDFDQDGDLDIIGNSAEGPVQVYINPFSGYNHSLTIALLDRKGNRNAVGARVVVHYMESGKAKQQMRYIKASGGYQSFDPLEAHFGLGRANAVSRVEVTWPDGKKTVLQEKLASGRYYQIERK